MGAEFAALDVILAAIGARFAAIATQGTQLNAAGACCAALWRAEVRCGAHQRTFGAEESTVCVQCGAVGRQWIRFVYGDI